MLFKTCDVGNGKVQFIISFLNSKLYLAKHLQKYFLHQAVSPVGFPERLQ